MDAAKRSLDKGILNGHLPLSPGKSPVVPFPNRKAIAMGENNFCGRSRPNAE
jgi:hypothetical protein